MFGFVAYQLWGTGIETARAQNRLENEFEQMLERTSTTTQPTTSTTVVPTSSSPLPVTSIAALTAVVVGAYQLAKCLKNSWIGLAVGVLPFIVGLYFVYQNVNRLLPATL